MEMTGTQDTWFNTFNTSSEVHSTIVSWPDDGDFHAVSATLRTIEGNTEDLSIEYSLDGVVQATDVGAGFYGTAMYLCVHYLPLFVLVSLFPVIARPYSRARGSIDSSYDTLVLCLG